MDKYIEKWEPSKPKITFHISGNEAFQAAIKTLLPVIYDEFSQKISTFTNPLNLGIVCANESIVRNESIFRNDLIKLLNEFCSKVIVLYSGKTDGWKRFGWYSIAGNLVQETSADLTGLVDGINRVINEGSDGSFNWRHSRLLQRLQMEGLYDLLQDFGHNRKNDITNLFLAPAKMLLEAAKEPTLKDEAIKDIVGLSNKHEDILDRFIELVCNKITADPPLYGPSGAMICEYGGILQKGYNEVLLTWTDEERKLGIAQLEQLMMLLTECRVQAGIKIYSSTLDSSPILSLEYDEILLSSDQNMRRILVIDDNIDSWKPVLRILKNELNKMPNCKVEIYISEDADVYTKLGDDRQERKMSVNRGLPDFDLILLDIYLKDKIGRELNGLQLLEKIRSRIMHLPVVLWTTSTDKDLPSQAALANGFIFKKTANVGEIAEVINKWLSVGKSQRLWSLPNPFFDYSLRDPVLREVALAFTKWTLRYMDCFHAVDHFYFKYFNDHGGRHILGVMDATAKLLRPYLFEGSLLSKEDEVRTKQLFCLYIAILCHEFGMFPIYEKEKPDNWIMMENIRKLHGIRGMLMLLSNYGYRDQFNVQGVDRYISKLIEVVEEKGLSIIALLVGYHQRCLDISGRDLQYYTDNGFTDSNRKAKKIFHKICCVKEVNADRSYLDECTQCSKTTDKIWKNWEVVVDVTKNTWKRALGDDWKRELTPIRQMCAILRFGDALDVDHTRVPADFLLNQRDNRRSLQDVEDCKRQVLAAVNIDQGMVSLDFFASEPSSHMYTQCMRFIEGAYGCCKQEIKNIDNAKEKEDFEKLTKEGFFEKLSKAYNAESTKDWFEQFRSPWPYDASIRDTNIESYIKSCLQIYFTFSKLKPEGELIINDQVKLVMATLSAILVIMEIEDEYNKSIKQVELDDVIRLRSVSWWKEPSGLILPSIL